mgnify:CR=1 FL=1
MQSLSELSNNIKAKKRDVPDEEDSDLLFLRSLLPDMKKLSDAKKNKFKQRIFAVYDEIINEAHGSYFQNQSLNTSIVSDSANYSNPSVLSNADKSVMTIVDYETGKLNTDLINATVSE